MNQRDIAIRTNEWKLIFRKADYEKRYNLFTILTGIKQEIADYELYDLKNDPNEQNNVVKNHPEIVKNLKKRLDTFMQQQSTKQITPQLKLPIQGYF